MFMVNPH
jgi:hypothetical protein